MTRWFVLSMLAACEGDPEDPENTDPTTDPTKGSVVDADGDGFSAPDDCDDEAPGVFPGAEETCDGVDQDCDGTPDDDPVDGAEGFLDLDGDGFGTTAVQGCDPGGPVAPDGGDCADDDPTVHPAAGEACDGRDGDCDPTTPDTAQIDGVGFASIGAALAAAGEGAVIEICDGTFHEHGLVVATDVTVRSFSGDRDAVVIDGDGAGWVFGVDAEAATLRSLTIVNGRSQASGAAVRASGALVIDDCVVSDHQGGAVNAGDLVVTDSVFQRNVAGFGGAIYVGGTATVTGSTFEENEARDSGGAIWAPGASVTVDASTFARNRADFGGGISAASLALSDTTFTGNSAGTWGGAVDVTDLTTTGGSFESNVATPLPYDGYGGAVSASGAVVIDGTTFVANDASRGGAMYLRFSQVPLDVRGATFDSNTADHGGAVYLEGVSGTADAATTFLSNRVGGTEPLGGALYLWSVTGIAWTGGQFVDNRAWLGGAIYVAGESGAVADVSVEGNTATIGAGLYFELPPGSLVDSVLVGNAATYAGGGVSANDLYLRGGELVFERVELRGNSASTGGAMDVYQTDVVLNDCVVEENVASDVGGGVYLWPGSTLTVDGSDFGTDALANAPDDVWAGVSREGFGEDVSFSCEQGCTAP